jgi:hypothetical protein
MASSCDEATMAGTNDYTTLTLVLCGSEGTIDINFTPAREQAGNSAPKPWLVLLEMDHECATIPLPMQQFSFRLTLGFSPFLFPVQSNNQLSRS